MNKRVLIVEGESIIAKAIKNVLCRNNYKVVGIANSESNALDFFENSKIDLVICNINLGAGGSGINLVRNLKSISNDLLIIYLTDCCDKYTMAKACETHPDSFITVPFTASQLMATLQRIFAFSEEFNQYRLLDHPTKREMQILNNIANGNTSHEIADELGIKFETVQTHRKNLLHKYNLHSSVELIALAVKKRWIN